MPFNPDSLVDDYDDGRLSRRGLIAGLAALGAAGRVSAGAPAGDAAVPLFSGRNIDHIALNVSDVDRSAAFYKRHLGLRKIRGDARSAFLGRENGEFFVALFKSDTPGLNHFCFGIDEYDVQDAARKLKAEGREVRQTSGRIYFKDPDGIEVQLAAKRSL
jgi:catechol 2,3-dioxygenase-like lactoylglutathione lyase family enzyme